MTVIDGLRWKSEFHHLLGIAVSSYEIIEIIDGGGAGNMWKISRGDGNNRQDMEEGSEELIKLLPEFLGFPVFNFIKVK